MRCLCWDDEPEEYMDGLKEKLIEYGIEMVITQRLPDFDRALRDGRWDFVVLDFLWDSGVEGLDQEREWGLTLAQRVREKSRSMPIFFVTKEPTKAKEAVRALGHPVDVKDKGQEKELMAFQINQELEKLGYVVDAKRAFLIYGSDKQTDGATGKVERFLTDRGIRVVKINPADLFAEIGAGLVAEMNKCAVIVAICTPDEELSDGTFQPVQSVLMEIGVAIGMSRGLERLTLLQRWASKDPPDWRECAMLPRDLGGAVPIKFHGDVGLVLDQLEKRLRRIGVDI